MMRRGLIICGLGLLAGCVMDDLNDVGRMFDVPTPGEAARWALDQHDPNKRREGITLLSNATFGGTEVYVRMYREYVENDENPLVKSAAITALARHGTPEDALLIAPWCEQSTTQSLTIRTAAAQGLQRLHNADVVPVLIRVSLDRTEDGDVRSACCIALGQYAEDRSVQALIASLDARELGINAAAAESLHQLTGQRMGMDLEAWQTWYASTSTPFAGRLQYHYPTYSRDKVWWEHVAFWLDEYYEPSMPPTGMTPKDEVRTYDDFGPGATNRGSDG